MSISLFEVWRRSLRPKQVRDFAPGIKRSSTEMKIIFRVEGDIEVKFLEILRYD